MGLCSSAPTVDRVRSSTLGPKDCNLYVGTWNVGNAPPSDDLSPFIPMDKQYDVLAIGTQECEYKQRAPHKSCHEDWVQTLVEHLGPSYELIAAHNLMEMRLVVFAHTSFKNNIHDVNNHTEATGIGGVVGNKGGVAISMCIKDTSVCFLNCHLAAHQDKTARRNADVAEIIRGIKLGKDNIDMVHQFHHVFWFGDLNYRLAYGDQGDAKTPSEELFNEMVQLIDDKEYKKLFACDQLTAEMKAGNVFRGFQEGVYNFPPTFKVERNKHLQYKKQRSPAWCDRVLWKSMPGCVVKQTGLHAAPGVQSSDHKPVYSTFVMQYSNFPQRNAPNTSKCRIRITDLKGADLPAEDIGNSSDPYVIFQGHFLEDSKSGVKTKTKPKTLNPAWKDKEVPLIKLAANSKNFLRKQWLQIRVYDYDATSADDRLGNGVLHLSPYVDAPGPQDFEIVLSRGNLPHGKLTGKIAIEWE